MVAIIVIFAIAIALGIGLAQNGSRKRRDRRDANRFLAEQYRAQKRAGR